MNKRSRSSGRVANSLVALSSAAVMAVYAAGYVRTRAAAEKLRAAERPRVVIPSELAPAVEQPPAAQIAPLAATPKTAAPSTLVAPSPVPAKSAAPQPAASTSPVSATSPEPSPSASPTPSPAVEPATPPAASAVASPSPTPSPAPVYKDGTFSGWGTSRHGDIEATVVIDRGRIVSAAISQCWTRYSCSWVAHLQGQVVTRQSPEVDYVTGATQSANAFYYAVVQALSKAK